MEPVETVTKENEDWSNDTLANNTVRVEKRLREDNPTTQTLYAHRGKHARRELARIRVCNLCNLW